MADTEALVKQSEAQSIAIKADINVLVKDAKSLDVFDEVTYGKASDLLKIFKAKVAWLDEDRKSLTKPLDEAKTVIMGRYKPQIEECELAIKELTKKGYAYNQKVEAERRAEETRRREAELKQLEENKKALLETAAETNNEELLNGAEEAEKEAEAIKAAPVEVVKSRAVGTMSTAGFVDHFYHEVINDALVPAEFKATSDKKVKEKLKKLTPAEIERLKKGEQIIPGLRIWNEPTSVSR